MAGVRRTAAWICIPRTSWYTLRLDFNFFFMENLTLNLEELYEQIKERAFTEGAFTREEWDDVCDELLDSKREFEEISDDVDWTEIKEALKARYDEFEAEIPEM